MACYCCVLGCKNNNHKPTTKHFFRFPKNDEKRQILWKRFTRKRKVRATAVICEDHFDIRYIRKKDKKLKLSNDAVPTIFFEKSMGFDGNDYFGDEANEMDQVNETCRNEEIVEIETAFVNDQLKLNDLKSRCRFCVEIKEEIIDISSFSTYNVNIESFLQALNLHIIESDFFPSSVCEECFKQVLLIDTFIIKCKTSDQWLWGEIGKLKTITAAIPSPIKIDNKLASSQDNMPAEEFIDMIKSAENSVYAYQETGNEPDSQKCQTGIDEIAENRLYTISFEDPESGEKTSSGLSASLEESATIENDIKRVNKKVPSFAFMDPAYNKFAMKSYSCEICCKVFAGLKTYKSHICDVPEIRCTECGDTFETVFSLKAHQRHLHNDNLQKNYCPICKTVITGNPTAFKRHKTKCNRTRTENIQCEVCPKTFSTNQGYTVHRIFHDCFTKKISKEDVLATDNAKPVKKKGDVICEVCGKTYTTIGDCRRHIKLKHTEINEVFSCDICNKNYPSKSVLKDHFRNTHVVNEVACTFCGKVFRNKTHLKKHMVYHDESKKVHKCYMCPEQPGFINKVGLIRHLSRHANNDEKVKFNCEICVKYKFHTSLHLKSHMKHVHGIDQ